MGPGSRPQKAAWKVPARRCGSRTRPSPWQCGPGIVTQQPSSRKHGDRCALQETIARLPRLLLVVLLLVDRRLAAIKSSHPEGSRRPVGGGAWLTTFPRRIIRSSICSSSLSRLTNSCRRCQSSPPPAPAQPESSGKSSSNVVHPEAVLKEAF